MNAGVNLGVPVLPKIELKIKLRNLPDLDVFSKSDPQVFVFLLDQRTGQWSKEPYAKTEKVVNKLSCDFVKSIVMDYRFESIQRVKFVAVDVDNDLPQWDKQELIGSFVTEIGQIIGSRGRTLAGELRLDAPNHTKKRGTIIVEAEEVSQAKKVIRFNIEATKLGKKGFFSSEPNTFFIVHRANESGVFSPIYQSPVVRGKSNPIFPEFEIKEIQLCNGDPNRNIKVEVKQFKTSGQHVILGTTPVFTFSELQASHPPRLFPLAPAANSQLVIRRMVVTEPASFLDYLAGGVPLSLVVAIDFTQSNGNPNHPQSLHFKSPSGENDYTRAISSVGNILQHYDSNRKFPVYGFGARVNGAVSHCFALNGNPSYPEVEGLDGILRSYWHALTFSELYGPTNFSPIINQTAAICRQQRQGAEEYYILLILTDGVITDMDSTIKAIVDASRLPLSIVIVGIGNANFDNMNVLDADDEPLQANGVKMARDIVQFVPLRDIMRPGADQGALAEAVLAEIPEQFVSYMSKNNIKPRPPARADTMQAMSNGGVAYSPQVAASAPAGNPAMTPQMAPHMTPQMAPHMTPQMAPHMTPQMAPHMTPQMAPHMTPQMAPHMTPQMVPQMIPGSPMMPGVAPHMSYGYNVAPGAVGVPPHSPVAAPGHMSWQPPPHGMPPMVHPGHLSWQPQSMPMAMPTPAGMTSPPMASAPLPMMYAPVVAPPSGSSSTSAWAPPPTPPQPRAPQAAPGGDAVGYPSWSKN